MNTILSVRAVHAYFSDGICRDLAIGPDPDTARRLAAHRLPVRPAADGFSIHAAPDSILDEPIACRATGWCRDPLFELYTELPAGSPRAPLLHSDQRLAADGATLLPEPGTPPAPGAPPPPMVVVDFTIPVAAAEHASLRIAFGARAMLWKYHLFGEYSEAGVELSGTGPAGETIAFRPSLAPSIAGAASWVSEQRIQTRQRADHRVQLRDTRTGRILAKRLPNPDLRTFGREPLRSGEWAMVVEAFIHP